MIVTPLALKEGELLKPYRFGKILVVVEAKLGQLPQGLRLLRAQFELVFQRVQIGRVELRDAAILLNLRRLLGSLALLLRRLAIVFHSQVVDSCLHGVLSSLDLLHFDGLWGTTQAEQVLLFQGALSSGEAVQVCMHFLVVVGGKPDALLEVVLDQRGERPHLGKATLQLRRHKWRLLQVGHVCIAPELSLVDDFDVNLLQELRAHSRQ